MTNTTPFIVSDVRCVGRYENQHTEFGRVINPQCVGCTRRSGWVAGHSYLHPVPVFEGACPQRLEGVTCMYPVPVFEATCPQRLGDAT